MRKILFLLPLLLGATPAFGQEAPPQLPPELTDPANIQRVTGSLQALSQALLNVRIGEVQAALEGRDASPQERRLTVGDMARRKDPDFDRRLQRQVAELGPKLQRSAQAVNRALPAMKRALDDAQQSLDRALANMPDPTYPKR
jgi:DNA-binding transcriptional MerR regulator